MSLQNVPQSGDGAGMAAGNGDVLPSDAAQGAVDHLVGYRSGKQDHKIGAADIPQTAVHLDDHLGIAVVLLAQFFISADHSFVSAYDHNTHNAVSLC